MKRGVVAVIVIAVLAVVYFLYNPEDTSNPFPKCPFYVLTGLKCPGCGSQRVIHSLLHLDLARALHYNMLLVVSLPVILFYFIVEALRTRCPRLYMKANSTTAILTILAVVIVWWVMRNVLGI